MTGGNRKKTERDDQSQGRRWLSGKIEKRKEGKQKKKMKEMIRLEAVDGYQGK